MSSPTVEIDLAGIEHNASVLVSHLAPRGIGVTGVTKAVLGNPEVARVLLRAGVRGLGDSRVENLEVLRRANVDARTTLVRSPMRSQVDRAVVSADGSCNTELEIVSALSTSAAARGVVHDVVLMVELGDLREGIMPEDVEWVVERMSVLRNVRLLGLGTNLACRSGVVPDDANMADLTALVRAVESRFDLHLDVVSGGNSATFDWAIRTVDIGRVNDLRVGEAILLGREPLHRQPIAGLRQDAFTVVAEVIESKVKPSQSWGRVAQSAFGAPRPEQLRGRIVQTILAIGEQDVDTAGLAAPAGVEVIGASSDHLVVSTQEIVPVGTRMRFTPNYSALLRAMTSPYVAKKVLAPSVRAPDESHQRLFPAAP